jgi:hypothetical protein
LRAAVTDRNQRVANLEDALAMKTAAAAGFEAQVMTFAKHHPDSPVMVDCGKRYKDNDIRRRDTTGLRGSV